MDVRARLGLLVVVCVMSLGALSASAQPEGEEAMPVGAVPVILDTDIGDDIDDTWALCFLLGRPEVDLKLVVTDYGNTERRAILAAKILETCGRTDVPVGIGVKTADADLSQEPWIDGYDLASYPGVVHEDGVQAMIDLVHASEEPVTILAIGPVPNLLEALRRDPTIAENARIVTMAGSVDMGYGGKATPDPEWNVRCNPAAWQAVLNAGWEITMIPLDICGQVILRGDAYARVAESDNVLAKTVIENYTIWKNRGNHPEGESSVLFDCVAAWAAYDESLAEVEEVPMSIDDNGMTLRTDGGRPVRCLLGWKDYNAYLDLLVGSLTE